MRFIPLVYNYSNHKSSDKPNAVSTTTLKGPMYKAGLALKKAERDPEQVELMYKRSSTIGTGFHMFAEEAMNTHERAITERYREREVTVDGIVYTISGSADLLWLEEDSGMYTLADWKTGYGKERNQTNLDEDKKQLSIYRWLFPELAINDTAYSLFISQSNNAQAEYPIELWSLETTQEYIETKLWAISQNEDVDCNDAVKYNACTYCDYICQHRQ